ncbi:beta-ketoacyl-[acyl-carrier-protein] synthase family protein [Arcobacter sp. F2176]|uniref:beta-ketoacyl-[acyl-carrier-protein] synthase family protein n=1 Tax=Arcobacter sp. F2176 TaxID=2044511 RepID=UPI00100AA2A9|nr:beta-ketoacyl-[acyl-carrier-protein] synthase family protein [Arcobacter sp. F2176]RXJ78267.1 beta-ketoacyl synthase [Arcobacter sp. F2176]
MKINNKAYINYFDSISCAGNNSEELFKSICLEKNTIAINSTYVKERSVAIGQIQKDKDLNIILKERCDKLLDITKLINFSNTLLLIGSSVGGMNETEKLFFKNKNYKKINPKKHPVDAIAYFLKQNYKFLDDISFSTACTSSANALGYAKEVISKGIYENVLVIGIDALSFTTVCGFSALSVLSSNPCTPFDKNREGMNVAEGFGILLLQNKKEKNSIELCGVGYSSDSHHMTQPHPEGLGAKKAMENALKNANLHINDISYINAHGTGTYANDFSELNAIKSLFTDIKPKVSSTKSITGHTLGAAGAIEAIISCMVLKEQIIPSNKGLKKIEIDDINYSFETTSSKVNYVLSNSFAFGGNNTSLIFGLVK